MKVFLAYLVVGVVEDALLKPEARPLAREICDHSGRIISGLPALNRETDVLLPGESRSESTSRIQDTEPNNINAASADSSTRKRHQNVMNNYCPRCIQLKVFIDANLRLDRKRAACGA
jgi:hypothetical protein